MKTQYSAHEYHSVSAQYDGHTSYKISGIIQSDGTMKFSGAYSKPGDGASYYVYSFETNNLTEVVTELASFVQLLPYEVQMPMNTMIVHIATVRNFLYGKECR